MRTILFNKTGGNSDLEIGDLPRPQKINAGEVRLKFLAGSLNHLDLWVLKGLPRVKYTFPHSCGADLCGEVIESKSKKFKLRDRVILFPGSHPDNLSSEFGIRGENAPGVFAEEVVVQDRFLLKAPKHLSAEEAASLPLVYVTAWQMITEKAELKAGKISRLPILVHGAGSGVSQAILEILQSFGAKKVGVTSRSQTKLKKWESRGYTGFVWNEKSADEIKAWSTPDRISIIFDHIGSQFFEMNIRLLKTGGKFITCGATSGFEAKLDLRQLYFRQLQLLGSTMGSLKHFFEVIRWVEKKKIRPCVSQVFSFNEVHKAYGLMESGTQTGKIVLKA